MRQEVNEEQKKKNLLLIVPSIRQGGFERVCVETARLLKDDFRVTMLIFNSREAHYDVSGIDLIDIDVPARDGKAAKAWNLFRRIRKIKRIKRRLGIDISYSFGSTANLANVMSRTRECVVTSMRSTLDFDAPDRLKRILKGSDLMISCSAGMEWMVQDRFGFRKTAVVYNPVDTEMVRQQSAQTVDDMPFDGAHPLIIAMGRDHNLKGYWHLLKGFSQLLRHMPGARLAIIGSGELKREKALIRALHIEEQAVLTGPKKNPFPYVRRADLFIHPSNHEGFPNAVIEAMALGRPVVATDCRTGPREILLSGEEYGEVSGKFPDGSSVRDVIDGAHGILIPNMDDTPDYDAAHITPDDMMLCTILRRVLESPELLKEYGERAAKRAAEFSLESYRQALTEILSALPGKR